ncbi:WXG100-like domain-containing protein [Thermomonospora cellulosilytica]|uniref:Outer membrane channel protein CpnT-like N-terminal domain-containing protein n=1 Tax=Thermomonospora cellulosilytica TaxID=1411118 RepID=A0A7W3RB94_9ACTN|nr:hypothetical protein [Thermomonospora cellulosilytica]MBA9007243.1 hypothetical protein [Thermomonospora cellulosilytica]
MGLQLPGELRSLLSMLGYDWPEADETKLFEMGGKWMSFAGTLQQPIADTQGHAQLVWTGNRGEGIEAFRKDWTAEDAPATNLQDSLTACHIIGAGLMVCAAIVLALKISVIVQLIMLAIQIAQAIATAVPTLGASLAQIPIFKMITGLIIDMLIDMAMNAILNG